MSSVKVRIYKNPGEWKSWAIVTIDRNGRLLTKYEAVGESPDISPTYTDSDERGDEILKTIIFAEGLSDDNIALVDAVIRNTSCPRYDAGWQNWVMDAIKGVRALGIGNNVEDRLTKEYKSEA